MKNSNLLILLLSIVILASCNKDKNNPGYDYMGVHDMYYTKFYKGFSPNPILKDSMTNQWPVEGTIPRGKMPFPFPGSTVPERAANQMRAGLELTNPIEVTDEALAEGQAHYQIFCVDCHGENGKGDGFLYTSGLFPAKPTSLVEAFVQNKPDGEIYYVITKGSISGLMGPYGIMITPDDRWKIIHYLRQLAK